MSKAFVHLRGVMTIFAAVALVIAQTGAVPAQQATSQSAGSSPQRFLVSGHSLTDAPLPGYVASIGGSLGRPLDWQQQNSVGSPLRWRTVGNSRPDMGDWPGYGNGQGRNGTRINVLQDFKAKAATPYDVLVVTEAHQVVSHLMWSETVRFLRHYHDRFIEHNAKGQTHFYESWAGVEDKTSPAHWIDYERAASTAWGCTTERVNVSLEHEGRTDRVKSLPAGAGLAYLLEQSLAGKVPALGDGDAAAMVDRLFQDKVHLTVLGKYYIALIVYGFMTDAPTTGAWHPSGVSPAQAAALQQVAWDFQVKHKASHKRLDLNACRSFMVSSFCDTFNGYWSAASQQQQKQCKAFFGRQANDTIGWGETNPFAFDAKTDAKYWYPAPPPK